METIRIEAKTLIISLVPIVAAEAVMKVFIWRGFFHQMFTLGVVRLIEITAMVLVVLIWGKGISSIGLVRSKIFFGLKKGLIWSACFAMAAFFASVILFLAGIDPLHLVKSGLPKRPSEIILFLFVGGFLAPIAEELFFRGLLYGFFRRWGVAAALILSTLIFVLFHPIGHQIPVTQAIGGIIFALAYELEGSLIVPITIHALGNTAIFFLSLIF